MIRKLASEGKMCVVFEEFQDILDIKSAIQFTVGVIDKDEFVAGKKIARFQYECFLPELVNHSWEWNDASSTVALEGAIRSLSALNSCARFVPDIGLFIRMHVVREAFDVMD